MQVFVLHLMPWPYLPDDFAADHDTAWVVCENLLYDPQKGHEVYNRYLDELEYADQLGFDGIYLNEHHQNAYRLMPPPNIMAACLARRTSRAKLVILGNVLSTYAREHGAVRTRSHACAASTESGSFPGGDPGGRCTCFAGGCRQVNVDISGRSTRVLRQGNGPPLIWLVDLFEDLGLQRADVLGCGLGGWMAAEFAVRYPERLERLILVDAYGLRVEGALAADEFALTMPSLVLWGESDQLVPLAHGRAYVAGLPRARLETIQGAAHYPYLEQTQAFIHLVEAFLEAR